MSSENAVITETSRHKMILARAGALTGALPPIVQMAFGDGGTDGSGTPIEPSESDTALKHELLRKNIDGYSFPTTTSCLYVCTLSPDELPGQTINEVGLIDSEGDLVAIKTMTNKGKDSDLEMKFTVEDIF